jgi:hypothetical protein
MAGSSSTGSLPALPLAEWQDTQATLHMWMQVVGKVQLALTPRVNHWWNITFHLTSRGLTTGPMPYASGAVQIDFDFITHELRVTTSTGDMRTLPLVPRAVADFHAELLALLRGIGVAVEIWPVPVEIPDPIPFAQDRQHASYDGEKAARFWRMLLWADTVLREFRARFIGKCSPVHFFWGSFDLAVTRFSGRRAPARPGADEMTREAYSHECISTGFWPGGGPVDGPAFYSYTAPAPPGLERAKVRPEAASWHAQLGEFLLRWDDVRRAASPRDALLAFCQSTYEAGATLAQWDRASLERS